MLADMGAEVVRVERPGVKSPETGPALRGRKTLELDLKNAACVSQVRDLARRADVVLEGFRPGVMERLGLGPAVLLSDNPKLVYGRMTGWGQDGPLAQQAGHDINYIAVAGALDAIGSHGGPPAVPLNLVGDYGGGALFLVAGVLAALFEARRSGLGQVVDCAICDGVVSMLSLMHHLQDSGEWLPARGSNIIDGGAHFYGVYECADGKYLSVGAMEPQFYKQFCKLAGLDSEEFEPQLDRKNWPQLRSRVRAALLEQARDEWMMVFANTEACVHPVLSLAESRLNPHLTARNTFVKLDGAIQPAPAPRFSRTPSHARSAEFTDAQSQLVRWS